MRSFVGFHGTDSNGAEGILKDQRVRHTLDEEAWLGVGAYFFENDILKSIDWCVKKKQFPQWAIIQAEINSSEDKIWDLDILEHYNAFLEIADSIRDRHKKLSNGQSRDVLDWVVMNMIYKAEKFDIARGVFPARYEYNPKGIVAKRTRLRPTQTILCVRNYQCVQGLQEVLNSEHQTA